MTFGRDPFDPYDTVNEPWSIGLNDVDARVIDQEFLDPVEKRRTADVVAGRKNINCMSDAGLQNLVNNPFLGEEALQELNRRADEEAERRRLDEMAREDQYMGSSESTSHDGGTLDIDVSDIDFSEIELDQEQQQASDEKSKNLPCACVGFSSIDQDITIEHIVIDRNAGGDDQAVYKCTQCGNKSFI